MVNFPIHFIGGLDHLVPCPESVHLVALAYILRNVVGLLPLSQPRIRCVFDQAF
jgi:hypothetical protein